MEGLPKVHSDHHLGEGVSATPSVVPSRTEDDKFAAESDPALGALAGKLHRFAVRNHRFFASFAAAKYTKHGPGALFVFGNSGLEHTLAEEGDGTCYDEATSCERQAVLVWGGITDRAAADCTLEDFTKPCQSEPATLRRSVEVGCDRTTFPLVLCAGLEYATDDVREGLRPPRWKKKASESKTTAPSTMSSDDAASYAFTSSRPQPSTVATTSDSFSRTWITAGSPGAISRV